MRRNGSKTRLIEIVAGPNGSGKSTFADVYLMGKQGRSVYLNPDRIAAGIAPHDYEKASFLAGRLLITDVKARIAKGESFCFESTLSGKTWLTLLRNATHQGYQITIYFLYLDSVRRNLQRIRKRVLRGGHHIPTEAVQRRHPRCFENFWLLYRPLCTDWHVLDNSKKKPKPILNRFEFERASATEQANFVSSFLKGKLP